MDFSHQRVIHQARLHHIADSLSTLYYGVGGGAWEQDLYWYYTGSGDHFVIAWSDDGLVALAFSHESERSEWGIEEDQRNPTKYFQKLPEELRALVHRAAARVERLATSGFWIQGDEIMLSDQPTAPFGHGLERLAGFGLAARHALFGKDLRSSWSELFSLPREHAEVALRLSEALKTEEKIRLAQAEQTLLLDSPPDDIEVSAEKALRASSMLAEIGVEWDVPVASIEAAKEEAEAAHHAQVSEQIGDQAFALFEAVRAGDSEKVDALLISGVDVDSRTVKDQFEHTPEGDTPLIQALKNEQFGIANRLLEAGADFTLTNWYKQSALRWAVNAQNVLLTKRLLAAGADPSTTERGGFPPLHIASGNGNIEIVDLLLDAGADAGNTMWNGNTAGDVARFRGHDELARRLAALAD